MTLDPLAVSLAAAFTPVQLDHLAGHLTVNLEPSHPDHALATQALERLLASTRTAVRLRAPLRENARTYEVVAPDGTVISRITGCVTAPTFDAPYTVRAVDAP